MSLPIEPKEQFPILAWRAFRHYTPGYLGDINGGHVYEPRKIWESKCRKKQTQPARLVNPYSSVEEHLAPNENCTCGFWSFKNKEKLVVNGYNGIALIGEVWIWGKIVECTEGYRSQYMYCNNLTIVNKELEMESGWLEYFYGVPCNVDLNFGARRQYFESDQPSKPSKPRLPYHTRGELWNIVLTGDDRKLQREARNRLRASIHSELGSKQRSLERYQSIVLRTEKRIRHLQNGKETLNRILELWRKQK